jgi:DNA gyrase/topoisomerase IV subunit B
MSKHQFKEVEILKLDYPDNVRTRPGLWGSNSLDADLLFRELIDNSIDIALKFKMPISVKAVNNQKDWNYISDSGIGFPLYIDPDYPDEERPVLLDMRSRVSVGSNFAKTEYSLGLHGSGSTAAAALSLDFMIITNAKKKDQSTLPKYIRDAVKEGKIFFAHHTYQGRLVDYSMISLSEIKSWLLDRNAVITELSEKLIDSLDENLGVLWAFTPDTTILETPNVTYKANPFKLSSGLFQYDKELQNIDISLELNGESIDPYDFRKDYHDVKFIEDKVLTLSADIETDEAKSIKFIVQLGYDQNSFGTKINASVNLLDTPTGKHVNLFTQALGQSLAKYNNIVKPADAKLGLTAFILNFCLEPLFNSQDKVNLSKYEDRYSSNIDNHIRAELTKACDKLIKDNKEYFDIICERIIQYRKATDKLSNIELLKSSFVMGKSEGQKRASKGIAANVYECTSTKWEQRELYITEGASASGNLVQARNKEFVSILPLI